SREIISSGGIAKAIRVDVRHEDSIKSLVDDTISTFGRLDVLVYNSGAIHWGPLPSTPFKKFRLMQQVNPEGLYATIQACYPHLCRSCSESEGSRIVVVSPPIYSRFFRGKTAYSIGKVGMSVLTKGLAADIDRDGSLRGRLSISSVWPAAAIQSAATARFEREDATLASELRRPTIFSDAVRAIVRAPAGLTNGGLFLDEDFLRRHAGVTDFSAYSLVPGTSPRRIMPVSLPDLTVAEQDDEGRRYRHQSGRVGKL
ncbi:Short-chain dehydrogenase, partial [Geosmithia morbida]